jgi:UPF0716 protein FxsA
VKGQSTYNRHKENQNQMLYKLILLFVVTPLIELTVLFYLGTLIGVLYTIIIVVVTGLIGAFLAKNQGLSTFSRIRSSIERGVLPADELFQGALILLGGLLLLTPGLITDLAGFAMLIPQTRNIVAKWLRGLIKRKIQQRKVYNREIR